MLARILAILAAVFLVGAIALGTLLPRDTSLLQGLLLLDAELPLRVQAIFAQPSWLWLGFARPLLVRPVWLLPAGLGIVLAGLAMSLSWTSSPAQRRRRS